jgi:hypothetical protein
MPIKLIEKISDLRVGDFYLSPNITREVTWGRIHNISEKTVGYTVDDLFQGTLYLRNLPFSLFKRITSEGYEILAGSDVYKIFTG